MRQLFLFTCLMAVLTALGASSATSAAPKLAQANPFHNLPRMYVGDIIMDKPEYAAGDTVKGQFVLWNYSTNDTGEIKCFVSLVGLDKTEHVAGVVYDRKQVGPIDIAAKSSKRIYFTYPISYAPDVNNLAIHVRVITSDGVSLAWSIQPIKITGGSPVVSPTVDYVAIGDQKYPAQAGPTLKEGDSVSFHILCKNSNSFDIDLTPHLVMTNKAGESVKGFPTVTGKTVTAKAGQDSEISIDLPTKGLQPQTYLAKISLLDSKGVRCAPYLYARYIIAGDIATMTSALTDSQAPYAKDSAIRVFAGYSGKPLDITMRPDVALKSYIPVTADLKVELYNESKELIAQTTLLKQSLNLTGYIPFELKLAKSAKILRAHLTATQSDKTLSTYDGLVVYDAGNLTHWKESARSVVAPPVVAQISTAVNWPLVAGIGAAVLVVVCIVAFTLTRRRKH